MTVSKTDSSYTLGARRGTPGYRPRHAVVSHRSEREGKYVGRHAAPSYGFLATLFGGTGGRHRSGSPGRHPFFASDGVYTTRNTVTETRFSDVT